MKLPKSVRIGSQAYRIVERDQSEDGGLQDSLAYTLTETNLIVFRKDLPVDRKRSILVHELLHAIIYCYARQDTEKISNENFDDWEHFFIATFQEPLLSVMRENPDLMEFLLGE